MIIQAGKHYIAQNGMIVRVYDNNDGNSSFYPFKSGSDEFYKVDGRCWDEDSPTDLICEVDEDIYFMYSCNKIPYIEFLQLHYLKYSVC